MNTITIKDVGVVTIPERNTKEEIISIVNTLKDDPKTLHEMLEIKPIEILWCEHDACLEVTEQFHSEQELLNHICKCHTHNCTAAYDNDSSGEAHLDVTYDSSDEEHMKWRVEEDAIMYDPQ